MASRPDEPNDDVEQKLHELLIVAYRLEHPATTSSGGGPAGSRSTTWWTRSTSWRCRRPPTADRQV
jgi:hypothetical protein